MGETWRKGDNVEKTLVVVLFVIFSFLMLIDLLYFFFDIHLAMGIPTLCCSMAIISLLALFFIYKFLIFIIPLHKLVRNTHVRIIIGAVTSVIILLGFWMFLVLMDVAFLKVGTGTHTLVRFLTPITLLYPFFLIIVGFVEFYSLYYFLKNNRFVSRLFKGKRKKTLNYTVVITVLGFGIVSWKLSALFVDIQLVRGLHTVFSLFIAPVLILYSFYHFSADIDIERNFDGKSFIHLFYLIAIISLPVLVFTEIWFTDMGPIFKSYYLKANFTGLSYLSYMDADKVINFRQILASLGECLGIAIGAMFINKRIFTVNKRRLITLTKVILVVGVGLIFPLFFTEVGVYRSTNSITSLSINEDHVVLDVGGKEFDSTVVILTQEWFELNNDTIEEEHFTATFLNRSKMTLGPESTLHGVDIGRYFASESTVVNKYVIRIAGHRLTNHNVKIEYGSTKDPDALLSAYKNACYAFLLEDDTMVDHVGVQYSTL